MDPSSFRISNTVQQGNVPGPALFRQRCSEIWTRWKEVSTCSDRCSMWASYSMCATSQNIDAPFFMVFSTARCTIAPFPMLRRSRGSMEERWTSDPTVAGSSPAAIVLCMGPHGVAVALRIPNPTTAVRFRLRSLLVKCTQTAGFEPAHAEHTRLAGEPRNHLGTSAPACPLSSRVRIGARAQSRQRLDSSTLQVPLSICFRYRLSSHTSTASTYHTGTCLFELPHTATLLLLRYPHL